LALAVSDERLAWGRDALACEDFVEDALDFAFEDAFRPSTEREQLDAPGADVLFVELTSGNA
jgi:hypothetical protein